MKTMKIFIITGLLLVHGAVCAQDLFSKLSDMESVNSITITKALLDMFTSQSSEFFNLSKTSELEKIEIYKSKKVDLELKKEIRKHFKDNVYEVLLTWKDEKKLVTFYGEKEKGKKSDIVYKSFVMFLDASDNEFVLIRLLGHISLKDIQNIGKAFSEQPNKEMRKMEKILEK